MKKILFILILFISSSLHSQTWTQTLNGTSIWSLAQDLSGRVYAGSLGSGSRIFRTSNGGSNWDTLVAANGQTVFSIAIDSLNNIFAANSTAGLLRSTNGGINFITLPVSTFGGSGLQAVACGKNGYVYAGTNGAGIYRSTDFGATFSPSGLASMQVVTLLTDKNNAAIVYAGTTQTNNGLYRSTDYGVTFSSNLDPGKNIFGIAKLTSSTLLAISTTAPGPVDRSTDGGLTWSTSASGFIARGIDAATGAFAFIAGNGGIFMSNNSGSNFSNFGITASSNAVIYNSSSSRVLAGVTGSSNGGVWWITFVPTRINSISSEVPSSFKLDQNFPNPFNPATNIRFELPDQGTGPDLSVHLVVYDGLGKEVETLVNENMSAGVYEINWNADKYAGGVYFYKLSAGNYSQMRKMVLLK